MPTQNVNLTDKLDLFVRKQVQSGYYNNASEVHRAALTAMARAEEERELKLEALRAEVQKGINDIEAGRCTVLHKGGNQLTRINHHSPSRNAASCWF